MQTFQERLQEHKEIVVDAHARITLIDDLLGMAGPTRLYPERWLVTFDDSEQLKGRELLSFCGFAAHNNDWLRFSEPWIAVLERYGLPYLRMSDAMNWRGPFAVKQREWGEQRIEQRAAALKEFATVIHDSRLLAVGVAHAMDHFTKDTARPVAKRRVFLKALEALLDSAPPTTIFGLMCDDSEDFAIDSYKAFRKLRFTVPAIKERVWTICFGDDKKYQPLQAADMIAYYTRAEALRQWHQPDEPSDEIYGLLVSRSTITPMPPIEQFFADGSA